MKVYEPSALTSNVPAPGMVAVEPAAKLPATPAMLNCVTLSSVPASTSLSFASRPCAASATRVVSSKVTPVSAWATGASLTGATPRLSVAVCVAVPSVTV